MFLTSPIKGVQSPRGAVIRGKHLNTSILYLNILINYFFFGLLLAY